MYEDLVKRLRSEADCPDNYPEDSNLMREAADAIEELSLTAESYKRSMEEWAVEAYRAYRKYTKAIFDLPKEVHNCDT